MNDRSFSVPTDNKIKRRILAPSIVRRLRERLAMRSRSVVVRLTFLDCLTTRRRGFASCRDGTNWIVSLLRKFAETKFFAGHLHSEIFDLIFGAIFGIFRWMKLDIPYYSQQRDIADEFWQTRACGILCLKMVLDFYGAGAPGLDEFIKIAVTKGAYHNPNGWLHSKQVEIASDFGLTAFRKEFGRVSAKNLVGAEDAIVYSAEDGLVYLRNFLALKRPAIVSVAKKFKDPAKFHQIVLTGFEAGDANGKIEGFYYNDPDSQNEQEGKNLFVPLDIFQRYWRGLAIFIHKN